MTIQAFNRAALLCLIVSHAAAQDVQLHVNPRWEECSFQLDRSLTQQEFREFTREAGLVACFRPLTSAKPMGAGRFEVSLLQWKTTIDETKGAWNNTFVHPDDGHYLVGGPALPFPGLTVRAGITDRMDAGVYYTVRPGANYGFIGGQVQYNLLTEEKQKADVTSRLGFNRLYGPEDVRFTVYTMDVVASKKFDLFKSRLSLSPYAGGSLYLTSAIEKSDLLQLSRETLPGLQCMAGIVANVRNFSVAAEYNLARVNTLSFRLGYNFRLWTPANRQAGK